MNHVTIPQCLVPSIVLKIVPMEGSSQSVQRQLWSTAPEKQKFYKIPA